MIIGNLTRDPEVKVIPSGTKVCSFSVATSRTYKDKDGNKQETTEFHNVSSFSKLAELAGQYLKKGQNVLVEGRLQTRSWETNGEKKYRTEIIADNIQFGMKPMGTGASRPGGVTAPTAMPGSGGGDGAKDAPMPTDAPAGGEKIDYPQDEINPDDIPF